MAANLDLKQLKTQILCLTETMFNFSEVKTAPVDFNCANCCLCTDHDVDMHSVNSNRTVTMGRTVESTPLLSIDTDCRDVKQLPNNFNNESVSAASTYHIDCPHNYLCFSTITNSDDFVDENFIDTSHIQHFSLPSFHVS